MTALTDVILVTGIALTALLFAFGIRRLLGLQLPGPSRPGVTEGRGR